MLPLLSIFLFALAAIGGSPLAAPLSALAYAAVVLTTCPLDLRPIKETAR